jgi:hypothetical protein
MRQHVEITVIQAGVSAAEGLTVLRELDKHIRGDGVIISLQVEPLPDGSRRSVWESRVRNGIIRWTERDVFDEEQCAMHFELIEGDLEMLQGRWQLDDVPEGCRIKFTCEFDIGIPSLSEFIDPLAKRILRETILGQLREIFGEALAVA